MNRFEKKNAYRRFNAIVVFSILVLIMFSFLHPAKEYSELENRYLQKMPELTIESVLNGEYMENMENYVNDRFAFRNFFVIFKSKIEYLMGKKENNGVYVCKNDYLIEKPQEYNEELIERNINAIKTLYNTDRYNVTVSVIPPAYEILSDYLPKNVYKDTIPRLNTKLNESFSDTGIQYVDTTSLLRKYKNDYLYYRTDHHLTSNGSYVVYHDLEKALGYTALNGDDFKISDVSRDFYGTTYSKSLKKTEADIITDYRPLETARFKVKFPYEGIETHSMYFPAYLEKKDKYSYFLDGNHALTVIESPNKNGKNLIVFKDSYAHGIVPFLANHFETIHMIDLRYYNDDIIKYMGDNNIKDVLYLYSASTFMSDETLQKTGVFAEQSAYLNQGYGMVYGTKPVDDSYFDDAAFIGDSLTDGLKIYANISNAEFLSGTSMTINGLSERTLPSGETYIDRIIRGGFKKVYVMLGTNEYLVEENKDNFILRYGNLIDTIKTYNPGAYVYIQSILPISEEAEKTRHLDNGEIKRFNDALISLSEEKGVYYIDVNRAMTDEKGNLIADGSTDGTHLSKEYYLRWYDYLKTHTVDAKRQKGQIHQEREGVDEQTLASHVADVFYENVQFENELSRINGRILSTSYGIDDNLLKSASGYASGGATAEEIAIFEVKEFRNIKAVKEKVLKYIENRKNSFQSYNPSEVPKLDNAYIYENGQIVCVCIVDNLSGIEGKIKDFLDR